MQLKPEKPILYNHDIPRRPKSCNWNSCDQNYTIMMPERPKARQLSQMNSMLLLKEIYINIYTIKYKLNIY